MPSPRYTDHGPAARQCPRCGANHRARDQFDDPIPCPPVDRWLISGQPLVRKPPAPNGANP